MACITYALVAALSTQEGKGAWACAKLTPASLQMLQAHTEAIYAADDAQAAEAVYLYHKCLTEISGNLAYAMVFQSFEKMIRNLIR